MDLALRPEDEEFASSFRRWLAEHEHQPPAFDDLADEVAWGRRWQATSGRRPLGRRALAATSTAVAAPPRCRWRSTRASTPARQAPQPVNRVGINLVGPTLLAHGTEDQRLRYLPPILAAEEIWCQLFSEPDAGSDLASLTTRGRAGRRWLPGDGAQGVDVLRAVRHLGTVPGPHRSRRRPGPQQGITALIVDMADPGVEIRPLVQMTGDAEFNEVFLTDVFVPAEHVIGVEGQGWTVAGSTLAHERGTNFPFKEQVVHETYLARLYDEARANGRPGRPAGGRRPGPRLGGPGRAAPAQPAHADQARDGARSRDPSRAGSSWPGRR